MICFSKIRGIVLRDIRVRLEKQVQELTRFSHLKAKYTARVPLVSDNMQRATYPSCPSAVLHHRRPQLILYSCVLQMWEASPCLTHSYCMVIRRGVAVDLRLLCPEPRSRNKFVGGGVERKM